MAIQRLYQRKSRWKATDRQMLDRPTSAFTAATVQWSAPYAQAKAALVQVGRRKDGER